MRRFRPFHGTAARIDIINAQHAATALQTNHLFPFLSPWVKRTCLHVHLTLKSRLKDFLSTLYLIQKLLHSYFQYNSPFMPVKTHHPQQLSPFVIHAHKPSWCFHYKVCKSFLSINCSPCLLIPIIGRQYDRHLQNAVFPLPFRSHARPL